MSKLRLTCKWFCWHILHGTKRSPNGRWHPNWTAFWQNYSAIWKTKVTDG